MPKAQNIEIKTRYYTNKHGYLYNRNKQVTSKWSYQKKGGKK